MFLPIELWSRLDLQVANLRFKLKSILKAKSILSVEKLTSIFGTLQRVCEIFYKVDLKSFAKRVIIVSLLLTLKILYDLYWKRTSMLSDMTMTFLLFFSEFNQFETGKNTNKN
jgi:hypothetical protein